MNGPDGTRSELLRPVAPAGATDFKVRLPAAVAVKVVSAVDYASGFACGETDFNTSCTG